LVRGRLDLAGWDREERWGCSSVVFAAFDEAGKAIASWAPTTAFSFGPIDFTADEVVCCFFNPDRRPITTFDAYCTRHGEDGNVEQSGTYDVSFDKGKLRAASKIHGRPKRAR
jgi:hypothetical protein